jgi:hypothetical protein
MSLITHNHLNKDSILETNNDGSLIIFGSLNDLNENVGPKIMKKVSSLKTSFTNKIKPQKELASNLDKIKANYKESKPPSYENTSGFELQNDMSQAILNTLLISKKLKEVSIEKVIYNAFNHYANPTCTRFKNKECDIELQLLNHTNDPNTRNHSVVSKSSIDTVFSKRNHANSISSYTKRKSSIVTSVIEELNSMKQLLADDTKTLNSANSANDSKNNNLFVDKYLNTTIFESPETSENRLDLPDGSSPLDTDLEISNHKTLNDEYEVALNKNPNVILFPTVNCKNPSSNNQFLQSIRRLSQMSSDENANFIEDESYPDNEDNDESTALVREQSRYSDVSDNDTREIDNSKNEITLLKNKKSILKGKIKIKDPHSSHALLFSNLKVKLCGYKLIYDHSVLIDDSDNVVKKYNNLSPDTESVRGLRITKPFVTKEIDILTNHDGVLCVLDEKDIFFEYVLDSTEFPSTLDCQYGKIEYRLELYSNIVNVGNVILTENVTILKTLEPKVCNLIDQNDSVYKLNNSLNVNNKRSTDNGQIYKLRYKDLQQFGFNIQSLVDEDEYLKKEHLFNYMKEHQSCLKNADYLESELRQPKIFYDIFLSSKTIIMNEPFQFYFAIKKALHCKNRWFITECTLTLEQHYCFPYTKEVYNKDYEHSKIDKKKYKKIFVHSVCELKPKLKEEKESVLIEDAVISSDLAFYNGLFDEYKDYYKKNTMDNIIPHYDELNTLKPEVNKEIKRLISVTHKLRINIGLECDRSAVEKKGVKLKKQFSMSLPVYVITSSMYSTMILPEYIE